MLSASIGDIREYQREKHVKYMLLLKACSRIAFHRWCQLSR